MCRGRPGIAQTSVVSLTSRARSRAIGDCQRPVLRKRTASGEPGSGDNLNGCRDSTDIRRSERVRAPGLVCGFVCRGRPGIAQTSVVPLARCARSRAIADRQGSIRFESAAPSEAGARFDLNRLGRSPDVRWRDGVRTSGLVGRLVRLWRPSVGKAHVIPLTRRARRVAVLDGQRPVGFERAAAREPRPGLDLHAFAGQRLVRSAVLVVRVKLAVDVLPRRQHLRRVDLDGNRGRIEDADDEPDKQVRCSAGTDVRLLGQRRVAHGEQRPVINPQAHLADVPAALGLWDEQLGGEQIRGVRIKHDVVDLGAETLVHEGRHR